MYEKLQTLDEISKLYANLLPYCRSLTGIGVKETLEILKSYSELNILKFQTGEKVYDWEIPKEWLIRDAFIKDANGKKIIDINKNNLHVVNYSCFVDKKLSFNELKRKLHYLPNLPDAIPYRTSYYNKDWGFCLSYNQFKKLDKSIDYFVKIDSSHVNGELLVADYLIKGKQKEEIIFTSYLCHPSMINDNISGMVLWILFLKKLKKLNTKYSYRFILAPETIGAIAYLSKNEKKMSNVLGGFVFSCVSGPGNLGYKKTFLEDHIIDKICIDILKEVTKKPKIYSFDVFGSDERQYSSPSFRIPMGTITKDKYFDYIYYHTSKDDLKFAKPKYLLETIKIYEKIFERLEKTSLSEFDKSIKKNNTYQTIKSNNPFCEPMLSKRNLYPKIGGANFQKALSNNKDDFFKSIMWVLFYADGKTSINEIIKKSKVPKNQISQVIEILKKVDLIKKDE